jgi:hypothetical protein
MLKRVLEACHSPSSRTDCSIDQQQYKPEPERSQRSPRAAFDQIPGTPWRNPRRNLLASRREVEGEARISWGRLRNGGAAALAQNRHPIVSIV